MFWEWRYVSIRPLIPSDQHCFTRRVQEFAAVIAIDRNVAIIGDAKAALQCAAQRKLLTVQSTESPLSGGVLAVAPQKGLVQAALAFLADTELKNQSSWSGAHANGQFTSAQCSAGMLWALFHEEEYAQQARAAFEKAGVQPPVVHELDRCLWGRQSRDDVGCSASCDKVRFAHPAACPSKVT
eukprot:m.234317 g.234317  ORF g.234317 m.234317 type:complete len:183 (+) comp15746_c0_seq2:1339-1887(+)